MKSRTVRLMQFRAIVLSDAAVFYGCAAAMPSFVQACLRSTTKSHPFRAGRSRHCILMSAIEDRRSPVLSQGNANGWMKSQLSPGYSSGFFLQYAISSNPN